MTLKELLEFRAKDSGGQPFIYFNDMVVTFKELNESVNKTSNLLKNLALLKTTMFACCCPIV